MILITARASAQYTGRIAAELVVGDVVILIRDIEHGGDGSVLIHDMSAGIPARNWMPAGSTMTRTDSGFIFHHTRGEQLEVFLHTVYSEQVQTPELVSKLIKLGAEREFSDRLADRIHLLGEMELIDREYRTPAGPVDLLCQEADGTIVAVEVKRKAIDPNAVWQMRRYLYALQQLVPPPQTRGILVAPSLQKAAKALIEQFNELDYIRIHYEQLTQD